MLSRGEALTVHRSQDRPSPQRGGYGALIEERVRSWLHRKPGEGDLLVGEPSGEISIAEASPDLVFVCWYHRTNRFTPSWIVVWVATLKR